jgi:hypothetical protein
MRPQGSREARQPWAGGRYRFAVDALRFNGLIFPLLFDPTDESVGYFQSSANADSTAAIEQPLHDPIRSALVNARL